MTALEKPLPRVVRPSEFWPAQTVTKYVGDVEPCMHCGELMAYYWYGKWGRGDYVHLETDLSRCDTEKFTLAQRRPKCPECGSHELQQILESWADVTRCPCGYESRRSLGD